MLVPQISRESTLDKFGEADVDRTEGNNSVLSNQEFIRQSTRKSTNGATAQKKQTKKNTQVDPNINGKLVSYESRRSLNYDDNDSENDMMDN